VKLAEKLGAAGSNRTLIEKISPGARLDIRSYHKLKSMVHSRLVDLLDLSAIEEMPEESLKGLIRDVIRDVIAAENVPLNTKEQDSLISDVMDEILGLGPIEPLIKDDTIQDILVNTYEKVYVERDGILDLTPVQFRDNDHLMHIIDRIVSAVGRRIDESSPMVDARLPDGSRVNAIIPPLAIDGPMLSIRKFGYSPLKLDSLLSNDSIVPEVVEFLEGAIRSKLNILLSGGTGSGKTTLLNILSAFIPESERIITIEDSAELQLQQPHVVKLESRPSNIEGRGEVALRDLVKNSLRMRPDRIIVGEVRGAESMDMLQAMNTGHPGSMSTIHANSARDALSRLEVMVSMGAMAISERALRSLTASAINIIVHLARLPDGKRRCISLSEITGMQGDIIAMQDIFRFEQEGMDASGTIHGSFKSTGIPSRFSEHLERSGVKLSRDIFNFCRKVGK
jgi:pilus assembly protein CpaF